MDIMILIIIIIIIIFYYILKDNKEQFITSTGSIFRKQMLGLSIIGDQTTDINVYKYDNNLDPIIFNNRKITVFIDNYNNNNITNFLDNNQKESLIYASIKQTLYETKIKLNEDNIKYNFKINGFDEVDDVDDKIILKYINKIIDSININLYGNYNIKLLNKSNKKFFKKNELYYIDFNDDIEIFDDYEKKVNLHLKIIIQLLTNFKDNYIVSLAVTN